MDPIGSATMLEAGPTVLSLVYWFRAGGHATPAGVTYKPNAAERRKV
jgi:hypothetical protein